MAGENLGTEVNTEDNQATTQTDAGAQDAQELLDGNGGMDDSVNDADDAPFQSEAGETNTDGEVAQDSAKDTFEKQLAERDAEIARLKAQVAEAAKSAETAEELNARIAELETKAETERTEFELKLAGCRSTRAARALLDDHDGDISALKEAEPWLFDTEGEVARGVTGLPNAGAATNDDATLKHWREIAGLDD